MRLIDADEFKKQVSAMAIKENLNIEKIGAMLKLIDGQPTVKKELSRRSTGKKDISGQEVLEGDIIESHIGGQILAENMVIKYGTYQSYCPVDKCYMDSVGFYAVGNNLPDMPIGPLEDYAKVIGNTTDNPELVAW